MNKEGGKEAAVSEETIARIEQQNGITGGRAYGTVSDVEELVTEKRARDAYSSWRKGGLSGEDLDFMVDDILENVGDRRAMETRLYGMEDFLIDKLEVIDGDLGKLKEGGNYVAAVYDTDDYHNLYEDWHWAKVGDQVTLRYVDTYEYYNPQTGEVYPENASLGNLLWAQRAKEYREETYEVVATVLVSNTLTYRFYGDDEFVMNADTFKEHTGTDAVLYYAFDCADEQTGMMEQYLKEYTEGEGSFYDYESRMTRAQEFYELKNMFLFVGTAVQPGGGTDRCVELPQCDPHRHPDPEKGVCRAAVRWYDRKTAEYHADNGRGAFCRRRRYGHTGDGRCFGTGDRAGAGRDVLVFYL